MSSQPPAPASQTFPLPPLDADGRKLSVGGVVRVLSVESCASGLPLEDQARLRAIVGQTRNIVEFDSAGFVWLCFDVTIEQGGDFCIFPREVAVV